MKLLVPSINSPSQEVKLDVLTPQGLQDGDSPYDGFDSEYFQSENDDKTMLINFLVQLRNPSNPNSWAEELMDVYEQEGPEGVLDVLDVLTDENFSLILIDVVKGIVVCARDKWGSCTIVVSSNDPIQSLSSQKCHFQSNSQSNIFCPESHLFIGRSFDSKLTTKYFSLDEIAKISSSVKELPVDGVVVYSLQERIWVSKTLPWKHPLPIFKDSFCLIDNKYQPRPIDEPVRELESSLREAIRKSVLKCFFEVSEEELVREERRVSILFSGGLDSTLLTHLLLQELSDIKNNPKKYSSTAMLTPDKLSVSVDLINVSFDAARAPDRLTALASFHELKALHPNFPLRILLRDVSKSEVQDVEEQVMESIFPHSTVMSFNIGLVLHFASQCAGVPLESLSELFPQQPKISDFLSECLPCLDGVLIPPAPVRKSDGEDSKEKLPAAKCLYPSCPLLRKESCVHDCCLLCCRKLVAISTLAKNNGIDDMSDNQEVENKSIKNTFGEEEKLIYQHDLNSEVEISQHGSSDSRRPSLSAEELFSANFASLWAHPVFDSCRIHHISSGSSKFDMRKQKESICYGEFVNAVNCFVSNHPVVYAKGALLIVGNGADELFGGYARHSTVARHSGLDNFRSSTIEDVRRLWRRNMGRDDRCLFSDDQIYQPPFQWVTFPYVSSSVVDWVGSRSFQEITGHCDGAPNNSRKYLLRHLAEQLGLHHCASFKKRAMQFGSRSSRCSEFLVKRRMQTDEKKIVRDGEAVLN